MKNVTVEEVERTAHSRAAIMAIAAAIMLIAALLVIGDADYAGLSWRGIAWIVMSMAWLVLLLNGGGLRLGGRMRELLNGELSRQNRASAFGWAFVATQLTAMAMYIVSWSWELSLADALRLTSSVGLAAGLMRFAWLERN